MPIFVPEDEVRDAIRRACKEAGTMKAWANGVGVSAPFVCNVLGGSRRPSPKLASAVGYERADRGTAQRKQQILYIKRSDNGPEGLEQKTD